MPVFVIDLEGKHLLPTNEARARLLLKNGKASIYSVIPLMIILLQVIVKLNYYKDLMG